MKDSQSIIELIDPQITFLSEMGEENKERKNKQAFKVGSMIFMVVDHLFAATKDIKPSIIDAFEAVPDIYADIVSSATNPNCGCRGRSARYFSANPQTIKSLLVNYLNETELEEDFYLNIKDTLKNMSLKNIDEPDKKPPQADLGTRVENLNESAQAPNLAGQILVIPKNQGSYKQIIQSINASGNSYKGISILEKEATWELFFY